MTAPTTSLLPSQTGALLAPANPARGVSDDEQALIAALSQKLTYLTVPMRISETYYDGTQRLADLGVSIPPQLAGIRTVVDWPRVCVDPLVSRAVVDGFRLASSDLADELSVHWQANDMDAESPMTFLDSCMLGRGYMIVGAADEDGESPIITVESPFNLAMDWDPRTRRVTAAYQAFQAEGVYVAVLYLPDVTVSMSRDQNTSSWTVDNRDEHGFGEVPVVRFSNRSRSSDREGRSEITAAVRNTTDSACRSLLGMEIAREFYSVPHRYILGAQESDFQDAAGNPKSAIDMVLSKFLAFERDERGEMPQVGQFTAFDPSVFTKIIDKHGMLMASFTNFPVDLFGVTTTANPASADAIQAAKDGVNRAGRRVQKQFTNPLKQVQFLAWRFANDGRPVPDELKALETDWEPVETHTPSATADAMFKQKQAGFVTQRSRPALKRLGYSSSEIDTLLTDQTADTANEEVADVATDLEATQLRTAMSVQKDAANPPAPPVPPGT